MTYEATKQVFVTYPGCHSILLGKIGFEFLHVVGGRTVSDRPPDVSNLALRWVGRMIKPFPLDGDGTMHVPRPLGGARSANVCVCVCVCVRECTLVYVCTND